MSKALPYTVVPRAASHRSGGRVISDTLWLSCPLLAGAGLAAASWGQMSWWPSVAVGCVYALHVLRARPPAGVGVETQATLEFSKLGVVLHNDTAQQGSSCTGLSWAEMTRVEALTTQSDTQADVISFVLVAEPPAASSEPRHLVVSGAQAVSGQLLQAMSTHLGLLDQAQLLRAISRRGDGRFTLWQRTGEQG